MNKQNPGIEWTACFGPGTGYTLNVLTGCHHGCEWIVNGQRAGCYAKSQAESPRLSPFYPGGFETLLFHEKRLAEPARLKSRAGIFIDSMSDLFAANVDEDHVVAVLNMVRDCSWHNFMVLTKNPRGLLKFAHALPCNLWVGASTPPDFMFGKQLDRHRQERMLHTTLKVLALMPTPVRWLSAEPLSWDIAPILREYEGSINWMVIGAASNGSQHYPPKDTDLKEAVQAADDMDITTFFKGNLRSSPLIQSGEIAWSESFPRITEAG